MQPIKGLFQRVAGTWKILLLRRLGIMSKYEKCIF